MPPWWKDKTREYSMPAEGKAALFMVGGGFVVTMALGAVFPTLPGMTGLWQQVFAAHAFAIFVGNLVAGVVMDSALGFGSSIAHALVSRDTLMFSPGLTLQEVNFATVIACVLYVALGVGGVVEKACAKIPPGFPAALMMSVGILLLISAAELSGLVPRDPDPNPFASYAPEQWVALGVLAVMLVAVVTVGAAAVIVVVILHFGIALGLAGPDAIPTAPVQVPDFASLIPAPTGLAQAPISLAFHVLMVIIVLVIFESVTVGGLSSAVMASRNFTKIMRLEDDKNTSRISDDRSALTFSLIGLSNIVSTVLGGTPLIVLLDQAAIVKAGSKTAIPCLISAIFWIAIGLLAPLFAAVPIQVPSVAAMSVGAMLLGRASLVQWDNWTDTASASFMIMLVVVRQQLTPGVLAYGVVYGVLFGLQMATGGQKLEDKFKEAEEAEDAVEKTGSSIWASMQGDGKERDYKVMDEEPPRQPSKLFGEDLVVEEVAEEDLSLSTKTGGAKKWMKAKKQLKTHYGMEFDNSKREKTLVISMEAMFADALTKEYKRKSISGPIDFGIKAKNRQSAAFTAKGSAIEDSIYIFDAHMQLINHFQATTCPMDYLRSMMVSSGVAFANAFGCPFVKMQTAGEPDDKTLPLYSNLDRIVPTPANDWRLASMLKKQTKAVLCSNEHVELAKAGLLDQLYPQRTQYSPIILPMIGGVNLNDTNCVRHVQSLQEAYGIDFFKSFGVVSLKHEGCNLNVTGVQTLDSKGAAKLLRGCQKLKMPFVFHCDAAPVSEKKHLAAFKNIKEIEVLMKKHKSISFVWMHAGVAIRGIYKNYGIFLKKILAENPNLFISITPGVVMMNTKRDGTTQKIDFADLCDLFPNRFVVGTEDTGAEPYDEQIQVLRDFIKELPVHSRAGVAWKNAADIFIGHKEPAKHGFQLPPEALAALTAPPPAAGPNWDFKPPDANDGPTGYYKTIDCHMHLLDFIHRSTGTQSMLRQMDICNVSKGILFGMPCCKKWSFIYDKTKPLYYQDSYSLCYEYAQNDQMVADAWLALPDEQRSRFACCISGFKPTDLGAVDHIDRMYKKYPNMWRGVGEIMCRHDDLSTMLPDLETPAANHPAMNMIYEWAIENDLPCLVHHNANYFHHNTARLKPDQVGVYAEEVVEVLERYPKLKFLWCHAGISRSCFGIAHDAILDNMLGKFPNLYIDISWVVVETTICKPKSFEPKEEWLVLFEKYPKQFIIGSDAVGQYEMPEWLRAATKAPVHGLYGPQIVKYQEMLSKMSPATREAIAWGNCEELFFKGWTLPARTGIYSHQDPCCDGLCLVVHDDKQGEEHGEWIKNGESF